MSKSLLVIPLAALLMASTSWAEKPDYGRPGWYAGVGAGTGIAFLDSYIESVTGGTVSLDAGGSFNARGGYRVNSWFAVEALYEGVYGANIEISGTKNAAERTTNSFVTNFKLLLPIQRVHPYFMLGLGAQQGKFDAKGPFDALDLDSNRWDFTLRTAIGVDGYITEHWLVNFELAPSIRFTDYSRIPSETTDNVLLTIGLGVQYRW
jgi:hypothetical protein